MIELKAPAKINLFLNILSKREDNYHEIETILQTITLFDKITLEVLDYPGIYLKSYGYSIPKGEDNLAYKATKLIIDKYNLKDKGISITIDKQIPVGSGLGGGSSDAACVLIGLNRLFNLSIKREEFIEYAKLLGSDIAFFLFGKMALCKGIGHDVLPLPFRYDLWFILVFQEFQISTSWAYKEFDAYGGFKKEKLIDGIISGLKAYDLPTIGKNIYNSFEDVIYKYYPFLFDVKSMLLSAGCIGSGLSGKGPTIFGLVENEQQAWQVFETLKKRQSNLKLQIVRAKNF
jgi:4-diphosphocytidyl-2-C-methyl-D-erythritol kinase